MRYFLLFVPCVIAILVPLYNNIEPQLAGFPMFYWFLLAMIPISALFILAAYKGEAR